MLLDKSLSVKIRICHWYHLFLTQMTLSYSIPSHWSHLIHSNSFGLRYKRSIFIFITPILCLITRNYFLVIIYLPKTIIIKHSLRNIIYFLNPVLIHVLISGLAIRSESLYPYLTQYSCFYFCSFVLRPLIIV